jgi:DNA-binding LacI/PurR family transcriptional regulator
VMTSNDLTAIGAISAIYEAGLQVPRDISVIGFDDIEMSSAYNPALTTVRLSRADIATQAFFSLYYAVNGATGMAAKRRAKEIMDKVVPTQLILRKSTAPPID